MKTRLPIVIVMSVVASAASVGGGLVFGSVSIPVADVLGAIFRPSSVDDLARTIVLELRLPRVLLAFVVGGGLATVGVAMQALVRNPLAEPYILGISGGASAGASLFYLGFLPPVVAAAITMPVSAFAGGLAAIAIVFLVARTRSGLSVTRLLLAGVAVSALAGAVTAFVTFASPDADRLRTVLFWLMGSFSGVQWRMLPIPIAISLIGLIVLLGLSRMMDAFLLGEERAWNLGVPTEAIKKLLLVLAALITGPLVAAVGAIGFVGLIVPHIVRMLLGVSHAPLVAVSYFLGGVFLVWADVAARVLIPGQELPVGVVTALCGVPFFLWLLRRHAYQFG